MNFRSTAFACVALATAMSSSYGTETFITETPVISNPANEQLDISLHTTLSSALVGGADATTEAALDSLDLVESEWLLYEPVNFVDFIGGYSDSSLGLTHGYQLYRDIEFPAEYVIDGFPVTHLRVHSDASMEVLNISSNSVETTLAVIKALPAAAGTVNLHSFGLISVKTFANGMAVNWPLTISPQGTVQDPIEVIFQGLVLNNNIIGVKTSQPTTGAELYELDSGGVGCQIRDSGALFPADETEAFKSMNLWKAERSLGSTGSWSVVCSLNNSGEPFVSNFGSPALVDIETTEFILLTADREEAALTGSNALVPGTSYAVNVRHKYTSSAAQYSGQEVTSQWSETVLFQTENTAVYEVNPPTSGNFTVNEAANLPFTVTNAGTTSGTPVFMMLVPADVSPLGDNLSDSYDVQVSSSSCVTDTEVVDSTTVLTCELPNLTVGADFSVDVIATPLTNLVEIGYKVCNSGLCSTTDYEVLSIDPATDNSSSDSSSDRDDSTSTSPSSGGSISLGWILALLSAITLAGGRRERRSNT